MFHRRWCAGLSASVSFVVVAIFFALLFKYLPDVKVRWRPIWLGAIVTAALFTIGRYFLSMYLGKQATSSSYGAAGSVVVILLWVYYASVIMFLGAEFTQGLCERNGRRCNRTNTPCGPTRTPTANRNAEGKVSARRLMFDRQAVAPVAPMVAFAVGLGAAFGFRRQALICCSSRRRFSKCLRVSRPPKLEKISSVEALKSARETRGLLVAAGALDKHCGIFSKLISRSHGCGRLLTRKRSMSQAGPCLQILQKNGVKCIQPYIFTDPKFYAAYNYVEELEHELKSHDAVPVAVGSGSINDVTKLASHQSRPTIHGGRHSCFDGRLHRFRRVDHLQRFQADIRLSCSVGCFG